MNDHIFAQVQRLQKKYRTSDPFELMDAMNVVTMFSDSYSRNGLKGFCMIQNRTKYVVINNRLPDEEQRVVAAHDLGHIVVHNTDLMVKVANNSGSMQMVWIRRRFASGGILKKSNP